MDTIYRIIKRVLWPGPDYGTRARYRLRNRLLRGEEITTLDVGCGNGCMTLAAAARGGRAIGISNQVNYLARAAEFRDRLKVTNSECEFRAMDIYDLTPNDLPQFDQIILFEVLEHLYHDEFALSLCAALLKSDGWLHVTVPNRDNHVHFEGVQRTETGQHVRHGYDFTTLESMLRRQGLEPIDREGIGRLGTIVGFLCVAKSERLFGRAGSVAAFFIIWPLVKTLNLLPCKPWSLYVLAAKRTARVPAVAPK